MSATAYVAENYQNAHKAHGEIEYVLSLDNTGGAGEAFNEARYISATQLVERAIIEAMHELVELYRELLKDNYVDDWHEFRVGLDRSLRAVLFFFSKYACISGVELLPTPIPSIMNDGQIVLEWIRDNGRLSLLFAPNRILVYALVQNGDVTYGKEYMGVDIPTGSRSQLLRLQRLS